MLVANIFGPDILIVAIIAIVLLFGAARLPKMARNLGDARKEFKKTFQDDDNASKAQGSTATDDRITMSKEELQALIDQRLSDAQRDRPQEPNS